MLRARLAIGLALAAAAAVAVVAVAQEGEVPVTAPAESCIDPDSSYTSDSLHDIRSFADAMAIVRGVRQSIPPPAGPEGYAGLIGRRVTVNVERILWRRPNTPEPPRRSRFSDIGWAGTLKNKHPLRLCAETRMVIGRRYLAPVVRSDGEWYPFFTTRFRLRGDLVVGGVDAGEPNRAHHALVGRRVAGAVRLVARTFPYRTTVLHPGGSPGRRWQRADRDRYRLWGDPKGLPIVVAAGVTKRSRWRLYLRLPARGGMCVGMSARALWHPVPEPSGEGCGARSLPPGTLRGGSFFAQRRGTFVFGRVGPRASVRVRLDDGEWQNVQSIPTPIPPGGREYFWIVPLPADCSNATVQAYDYDSGNVTGEFYAACRTG